ncbi:hypothetical protein TNCV_2717421 [Trichonephila clavipes]|nr:hypothetical protein TNCV_2717421 [Trichonephila clavipes]
MVSVEFTRGQRGLQHLRDVALAVQYTGNPYLRNVVVKFNTTPNLHTGCRTSVVMHNTTVQHPHHGVSNLKATTVMLQTEAGLAIKHNIVPFPCLYPLFIAPLAAQMPVVSNQG